MYLKSSQATRQKSRWRFRIWLTLALSYAVLGLLLLRQERPLALLDPAPSPVLAVEESAPDEQALELLARGDLYFDQGNQTAALESYREAVAADPALAVAYARWGQLLTLQLKSDEALIRTARAVALAPDNAEVLATHGMALEWAGQIPEAIRYAERAIEADPTHAAGYAFLAEAYVDSGRYDEAIQAAQQAIAVDPDDVWGWRNLAYAYENQGRYEEAIQSYQEAIAITPLSYLYMRLGRNEFVRENYSVALDYFREATIVDPRNPQGYAELGRAYWLLEDYATAQEELEKGIESDPTFGLNYAYLGYVYYSQRNFETAIKLLEQGVSFGYSSEEVFYNLGLSHAYLEQCEQALPWLQRALALNPDSAPAQNGMKLCGATG